jgi:hypothetical protein
MLHVISEENKMERTAVCDNIIYDWKKNEEQERKVMMMTTTTMMMMMMMISISYRIFIFIP